MTEPVEPAGAHRAFIMFLDPVTGEATYEKCPPYERLEWDAPDGTHWLWSAAHAAWAGWVPGEDRVLVLSATEMDQVYPEWADG
jgi:hypothetical protein